MNLVKLLATLRNYRQLFLVGLTLISVLVLVLNFLQPFSSFDYHRQQVLLTPHSPFAHLALAEDFQSHNQTKLAKLELAFITSLPPSETALLTDSLLRLKRQTKDKDGLIQKLKSQSLVYDHYPNYRDLAMQHALWWWQLKNNQEAFRFFRQAESLDPNNSSVQSLKRLITSQ